MNRWCAASLGLLAAIVLSTLTCAATAQEDPSKPAPAKDIAVAEPGEMGITAKARPILPAITTGDPLRIALHFETKDGPIDHTHAELAHQYLDRTASLKTFEIAVKAPGGTWQVIKPKAKELEPRPSMLYSDGTFLLELSPAGVKSIKMNGQEEASLPWDWDHKLAAGQYQIAVRGTLKLNTHMRRVEEVGKPPVEFPETKTDVAFKSKPITITVSRADMRNQTLAELEKVAIEALKADKTVAAEKLTVEGVDGLAIADEKGNRVIRVKANIPAPKPMVGGDGGIIIGPVIAGGTGYWQYEVVMTPAGKALSFARARKGFCVARGTKISTPDGDVAVENLRSGQRVWSFDVERKALAPAGVLGVFSSKTDETRLVNGHLRLTREHPVFVQRGDGASWRRTDELRVGDQMLSRDGSLVEVSSLENVGGQVEVFDVAVDGPHNFFAAGILVHNKSIAWTPQHFVPWYALWNRAPKE